MDERQETVVDDNIKAIIDCIQANLTNALLDFVKSGGGPPEMGIFSVDDIDYIKSTGLPKAQTQELIRMMKQRSQGFTALTTALMHYGSGDLADKLKQESNYTTHFNSEGTAMPSRISEEQSKAYPKKHAKLPKPWNAPYRQRRFVDDLDKDLQKRLLDYISQNCQRIWKFWKDALSDVMLPQAFCRLEMNSLKLFSEAVQAPVTDFNYMFDASEHKKRIYVLDGDAGTGKTTYAHYVAVNWTMRRSELRQFFDYVFPLQLKYVFAHGGEVKSELTNAIQKMIGCDINESRICAALNNDRTLLIFDSVDEMSREDYDKLKELMRDYLLSKTKILLITRRSHLDVVSEFAHFHLRATGFSEAVLEEYLKRQLHDFGKEYSQYIVDVHGSTLDVMRIPLFASIFCVLWRGGIKVELTEYCPDFDLMKCFVDYAVARVIKDRNLESTNHNIKLAAGLAALIQGNSLEINFNNVNISKIEMMLQRMQPQLDDAIKAGLIWQRKSYMPSGNIENMYDFPHEMIKDYLKAHALAEDRQHIYSQCRYPKWTGLIWTSVVKDGRFYLQFAEMKHSDSNTLVLKDFLVSFRFSEEVQRICGANMYILYFHLSLSESMFRSEFDFRGADVLSFREIFIILPKARRKVEEICDAYETIYVDKVSILEHLIKIVPAATRSIYTGILKACGGENRQRVAGMTAKDHFRLLLRKHFKLRPFLILLGWTISIDDLEKLGTIFWNITMFSGKITSVPTKRNKSTFTNLQLLDVDIPEDFFEWVGSLSNLHYLRFEAITVTTKHISAFNHDTAFQSLRRLYIKNIADLATKQVLLQIIQLSPALNKSLVYLHVHFLGSELCNEIVRACHHFMALAALDLWCSDWEPATTGEIFKGLTGSRNQRRVFLACSPNTTVSTAQKLSQLTDDEFGFYQNANITLIANISRGFLLRSTKEMPGRIWLAWKCRIPHLLWFNDFEGALWQFVREKQRLYEYRFNGELPGYASLERAFKKVREDVLGPQWYTAKRDTESFTLKRFIPKRATSKSQHTIMYNYVSVAVLLLFSLALVYLMYLIVNKIF